MDRQIRDLYLNRATTQNIIKKHIADNEIAAEKTTDETLRLHYKHIVELLRVIDLEITRADNHEKTVTNKLIDSLNLPL